MATYVSQTTSNGAEVSDIEAVKAFLNDWEFIPNHGELTVELTNNKLHIWGEAELNAYRPDEIDHVDERYEHVETIEFLEELADYLEEDLIIQTIGQEKLRYPFHGAVFAVDHESGEVRHETLQGVANEFLDREES